MADHSVDPARPGILEAQLVASSQGDQSSFARLYDDLAPRVFGLVLRILGDVHESEAVTQKVFLEVWHTCHCFDPDQGSAPTWVMTRAHRCAVERLAESLHARATEAKPIS